MCGAAAGCCGRPCKATTSFSESTCRLTLCALRLTDRRCFIFHLVVKLFEIFRIANRQLCVDLETCIGPTPNPLASLQIWHHGFAVARITFLITTAQIDRSRPASPAFALL